MEQQQAIAMQAMTANLPMEMQSRMNKGGDRNKKRNLPGIPSTSIELSSDEEESSLGRLPGCRGSHDARLLASAMERHPDRYAAVMEQGMKEVLERMGSSAGDAITLPYAEKAMAICKQRTLGYLVFGLCNLHRLQVQGKENHARLLTMKLLAAADQFCLDDNWAQAWRQTGLAEPPWAAYNSQDRGSILRSFKHSSLIPPEWMAIYLQATLDDRILLKSRGKGFLDNSKDAKKEGAD